MLPQMLEATARRRLNDWTSPFAVIQRNVPDFEVVPARAQLPHRGVKVTCSYQRALFRRLLGKARLR
jgi:hypothetical protein